MREQEPISVYKVNHNLLASLVHNQPLTIKVLHGNRTDLLVLEGEQTDQQLTSCFFLN